MSFDRRGLVPKRTVRRDGVATTVYIREATKSDKSRRSVESFKPKLNNSLSKGLLSALAGNDDARLERAMSNYSPNKATDQKVALHLLDYIDREDAPIVDEDEAVARASRFTEDEGILNAVREEAIDRIVGEDHGNEGDRFILALANSQAA